MTKDYEEEIIEILSEMMRNPQEIEITVGGITEIINQNLPFYSKLEPRLIGDRLRSMGFKPYKKRNGFTVNIYKERYLIEDLKKSML